MFGWHRERDCVWLSAWQQLDAYEVKLYGYGSGMRQTVPIGVGTAHAVPSDGDRHTAVCGRFVRLWTPRRFPPDITDDVCPDCERALQEIKQLHDDLIIYL